MIAHAVGSYYSPLVKCDFLIWVGYKMGIFYLDHKKLRFKNIS